MPTHFSGLKGRRGARIDDIGLDGQRGFVRFCSDFQMALAARIAADRRMQKATTLEEGKAIIAQYRQDWNYGGPFELQASSGSC